MNIIEAFNKMNQGEVVVDPEGGVWKKNPAGWGYAVKWPTGFESNEGDVLARLIPGEWEQKDLRGQ